MESVGLAHVRAKVALDSLGRFVVVVEFTLDVIEQVGDGRVAGKLGSQVWQAVLEKKCGLVGAEHQERFGDPLAIADSLGKGIWIDDGVGVGVEEVQHREEVALAVEHRCGRQQQEPGDAMREGGGCS